MNKVDKDFLNFIKKIDMMEENEIFYNIKNAYLMLTESVRDSIEDFLNKFGYWGRLDYKNNNYEEIKNKAHSLKDHLKDYMWLYQNLGDYKSKKLLYGILNNWYKYDFLTVKSCLSDPYLHYFNLDLIPNCNNEVLVDLGAYTGDSVIDFIKTYGTDSYKKIYCYEMTDETFAKLKDNLSIYDNIVYKNNAVGDENETIYIEENNESSSANKVILEEKENLKSVQSVTLDSNIKEKITMIKMDIEGSEQKAILGSINHIKNDTPTLLISVYHNNEDLWKIPKMISEINANYTYYLRCYGNNIFPTEIVLFAIPKESK